MKKFIFLTSYILLACAVSQARAQNQPDIFDIDDIINYDEADKNQPNTTEDVAEQAKQPATADNDNKDSESRYGFLKKLFRGDESAQKAQSSAGQLLERRQNMLELRDSQKRLIKEGQQKRLQFIEASKQERENSLTPEELQANLDDKIKLIIKNHAAAPFGLYWGTDKEQTEMLGFELQPAERKDYTNVYNVANPKQNVRTFDIVTAIFGEQNKLWCIFAQSTPQEDTPQADEVLKLYRKYYEALKQKYGNAKQYFTSSAETREIGNGEIANKSAEDEAKIGGDNFLAELQNGTAVLYATFENEELGITLGVSVDGDGKSYISLDYKNLIIMKEEHETKLNNLISDI